MWIQQTQASQQEWVKLNVKHPNKFLNGGAAPSKMGDPECKRRSLFFSNWKYCIRNVIDPNNPLGVLPISLSCCQIWPDNENDSKYKTPNGSDDTLVRSNASPSVKNLVLYKMHQQQWQNKELPGFSQWPIGFMKEDIRADMEGQQAAVGCHMGVQKSARWDESFEWQQILQ